MYVFLFTNSCNHSKLSLGRKHHPSEQVNVEENKPTSIQVESENSADIPAKEKEKKSLENRAVEQIDLLLDEKSREKLHQKVERSKERVQIKTATKKQDKKTAKTQEGKDRDSTALVIFGLVLLFGSVALVLYAIYNLDNNDGSAEGCLTSLFHGRNARCARSYYRHYWTFIGARRPYCLCCKVTFFTERACHSLSPFPQNHRDILLHLRTNLSFGFSLPKLTVVIRFLVSNMCFYC